VRSNSNLIIASAGAILGVALFFIAAVLYQFDPAVVRVYPRCLLNTATGLECPGCGGTRAVHQLLHGNLLQALRLNALLVTSLPLLALSVILEVRATLFGIARPAVLYRPALGWTIVAVLVLWTIGRNMFLPI
jgi:uncharacterized protein DUF2752